MNIMIHLIRYSFQVTEHFPINTGYTMYKVSHERRHKIRLKRGPLQTIESIELESRGYSQ